MSDNIKYYLFRYSSEESNFQGEVLVEASCIAKAQTRFLEWVKYQPEYLHMWDLAFKARIIDKCILRPVNDA